MLTQPLQIWAGHECTVVRIKDEYRFQGRETGHDNRIDDLGRMAALGVKCLRYPVLWETVAPVHPIDMDFTWHDARLSELQRLHLTPIIGLLHHGSGPSYTSLVDDTFPALFARFAAAVAKRYPWIERYTPVNEPLTTARFCGLYGHWHPHGRSDRVFLRALVNECLGTALAMRAIRQINPDAQLIQTEDLGKTFSTKPLAEQAEFENHRRWLTFDLLCGRVDTQHPLWDYLIANSVPERDLRYLVDTPCLPDIVGVNHYLTSDRYLDEHLRRYPAHFHGGNGRVAYADVEAVRVDLPREQLGPAARISETWERYGLPIAVTEAHHGCTRDEQLRWLMEVWDAAQAVRRRGVDVRAVTVWAMFGSWDWNSLLTRSDGHYEAGAFDSRSRPPRPTAVAKAVSSLASAGGFDHPVLDGVGWWRRPDRLYRNQPVPPRSGTLSRRLLITGATGTLGRALTRICTLRGLDHVALNRADLDIADPRAVEDMLATVRPWAVVNAAGYVRVADAAREKVRCIRENVLGAQNLAECASRQDLPFMTFSSDLVFDGRLGRAYVESDSPAPACVYGESKAAAEARVTEAMKQALVIRTSSFFGPWDSSNFPVRVLDCLIRGKAIHASESESVTPTYVPDLVHAALDLLVDGETGIWHVTNGDTLTWYRMARRFADEANLPAHLIEPVLHETRNTALASERGRLLPPLDNAIERFFRDGERDWRAEAKARAA